MEPQGRGRDSGVGRARAYGRGQCCRGGAMRRWGQLGQDPGCRAVGKPGRQGRALMGGAEQGYTVHTLDHGEKMGQGRVQGRLWVRGIRG